MRTARRCPRRVLADDRHGTLCKQLTMKEINAVRAAEKEDHARHEEQQRRKREHFFAGWRWPREQPDGAESSSGPWSHRDLV